MILKDLTRGRTVTLEEPPILMELTTALAQSAHGVTAVALPARLAQSARQPGAARWCRSHPSAGPPASTKPAGAVVMRTQHRYRPVRKRIADGAAMEASG
ncbi:MAG: hypothetical protein GC159_22715 [Phycisphaera sp.]|nr:hypothetical protein [Phycisphaera sp.]